MVRPNLRNVLFVLFFAAAVQACGSSRARSGFEQDASATGFSDTDAGAAGHPLGDAACASVHEQGTAKPLDLYIMLDKSSSEVGTKWDSAKAGLGSFLNDPASAGIRVAINFFPREVDATPACDQPAYKNPRVAFAALPGNAAAIAGALAQETPNGSITPIYPALGGALLAAIAEVKARPGDTAAVLLVTDGEPTGPAPTCAGVNPEDPGEIAKLAKAAFDRAPSVRTFVIGLPGVSPAIANQIAAAGGTAHAFLVSGTSIQADLQQALAEVRGRALPCEYELPAKLLDKTYAYDTVNVGYTRTGSPGPETIPQSSCAGEGWRYDQPSSPSRIILCAATCDRLRANLGGKIEIELGCTTVVK